MKHSDMTPAQKRAAVTFDLKAARAENKKQREVKKQARLKKKVKKLEGRLSKVKSKISSKTSNSTKKPLITSKALSSSKVNPLTKKISQQKNIITNNKLKRIKISKVSTTPKKPVAKGSNRTGNINKKPTRTKGNKPKINPKNVGLGGIITTSKKTNKVSLGSKPSQSSQAGFGPNSSLMSRLFKNTILNPDYRKRNNYKSRISKL
jgi:hypothetical protein